MIYVVAFVLIGVGLLVVNRVRGGRRHRSGSAPTFRVSVDDAGISCVDYQGQARSVPWTELGAVGITTTDKGPWADDVLWVLHDRSGQVRLVIPSGAEGNEALLRDLQALPGFDNEQVIQAMCSTSNAHFPCWKGSVTQRPVRRPKEGSQEVSEHPGA